MCHPLEELGNLTMDIVGVRYLYCSRSREWKCDIRRTVHHLKDVRLFALFSAFEEGGWVLMTLDLSMLNAMDDRYESFGMLARCTRNMRQGAAFVNLRQFAKNYMKTWLVLKT